MTTDLNDKLEFFNSKKILVGSPCGKHPVCDHFYDCLYGLALPTGSHIQRAKSGSVAQNLRALVDLAKDGKFDYLFIVEDDSMFHPTTVLQLLTHDKEVVAGLCLQRHPPFRPYIYDGLNAETGLQWRALTSEDEGLIKVAATGMGGILIRISVFDKIPPPYFYTTWENNKEWGQDILFGKALIEANIEVFCDLNVPIWHATDCSLAAVKEDGKWNTIVRIVDMNIKINI